MFWAPRAGGYKWQYILISAFSSYHTITVCLAQSCTLVNSAATLTSEFSGTNRGESYANLNEFVVTRQCIQILRQSKK